MKAKDLISILNAVEPDSDVWIQLGDNQEYRNKCAMAELLNGECLRFISKVKRTEIEEVEGKLNVSIILEQDNYKNLEWVEKEFDDYYLLKE